MSVAASLQPLGIPVPFRLRKPLNGICFRHGSNRHALAGRMRASEQDAQALDTSGLEGDFQLAESTRQAILMVLNVF